MELPSIGDYCTFTDCHKLNFLPIKCDACSQVFCEQHYSYLNHNCPNSYMKNNQVPVCPLCNTPIAIPRGQQPDIVVGAHIDSDCQSDSAKTRRSVFTNKCSKKGCKQKEIVRVLCPECSLNYCLKHRFPGDHSCEGKLTASRRRAGDAAVARNSSKNNSSNSNRLCSSDIQGNMSEDEALARALALSMQATVTTANRNLTQEEIDFALARQLQAAESQTSSNTTAPVEGARIRDRCNLS